MWFIGGTGNAAGSAKKVTIKKRKKRKTEKETVEREKKINTNDKEEHRNARVIDICWYNSTKKLFITLWI